MTTTIPSGLGATLGFVKEGTTGTLQTVTRWPQFDKETFELKKKTVQSAGLHQGLYEQGLRRAYVSRGVTGTVDMDLVDQQMGLLFAQMIGSTATAVSQSSGVYLQQHVPGDTAGLSMTVQKAVPETSGPGTVQTFTYNGVKITDWTVSVQRDGLAKLALTFDAWDAVTSVAYAAPSFVAANVLSFNEGAVVTTAASGSVQTSGGLTTITGAAAPTALIESISIKGVNGLDINRYTIGTATKAEQFSDAFRKMTGDITLEFANLTDYYTWFNAAGVESTHAVQFTLTGPVIGGALHSYAKFILPSVYIDAAPILVEGPKMIQVKTTFTVLDDQVNNPIEIDYQSLDSAV